MKNADMNAAKGESQQFFGKQANFQGQKQINF